MNPTYDFHGQVALIAGAALDNAARGIRVSAICPGCVDTPMGDGIDPAILGVALPVDRGSVAH